MDVHVCRAAMDDHVITKTHTRARAHAHTNMRRKFAAINLTDGKIWASSPSLEAASR